MTQAKESLLNSSQVYSARVRSSQTQYGTFHMPVAPVASPACSSISSGEGCLTAVSLSSSARP
jgi:hypothetical protein